MDHEIQLQFFRPPRLGCRRLKTVSTIKKRAAENCRHRRVELAAGGEMEARAERPAVNDDTDQVLHHRLRALHESGEPAAHVIQREQRDPCLMLSQACALVITCLRGIQPIRYRIVFQS